MNRDIRSQPLFQEAEALFRAIRQPGSGLISDAAELDVSPDGREAVYSGTMVDVLEGVPPTRICHTDLASGATRTLTFGPNHDRLPKFSPDGKRIAFLSDRHRPGDFQIHFIDRDTGGASAGPAVQGWVEYYHWSPDGRRILIAAAGHGADVAGGQGAVRSRSGGQDLPSWIPAVDQLDDEHRWRSLSIYDLDREVLEPLVTPGLNPWEAVWCGNESIAVIASQAPGEGEWYRARLWRLSLGEAAEHVLFQPTHQLGWPSAPPNGSHVAVVEAICSDRGYVAGGLRVLNASTGACRAIDTLGIDVTFTQWRSDSRLLLAGHRGFETVAALYDLETESMLEIWSSTETTTGGTYVTLAGIGADGDFAMIGESFARGPEIAVVRSGAHQARKSFDLSRDALTGWFGGIDHIRWTATDGLEVEGWLLRPASIPPYPTVMQIHGGPVYHWRQRWLGRVNGLSTLLLLKHGYAVFLPNPRGSTGRGQHFACLVFGDMGGGDAGDLLSGLDQLVGNGLADPARLGVTGGSYGGFMTSWLITQDQRFAAAVPFAPHNNQMTTHLCGNLPQFMALLLDDDWKNVSGEYLRRSPVMLADRVRTPTLHICGLLDRCTPAEEATQFHNALLESGVNSVLVSYPEEGHGVRRLPAVFDYCARVVGWFETHMSPGESIGP